MNVNLEDIVHIQETSLTIRGSRRRTTVPGEIAKFLKLRDGDRLKWILLKDGTIMVRLLKKGKKR
uniref:SpoVT-AbrB domain-containing protein n=1 Tax=Candidatus Methanophaga sp. ANME-1 ERB7 TaxID=2759913 RepID=A0A7G9Z2H7_9EURY|nr:hypothetical protein NCOPHCNO_00012 [Methanosarcinales archaeon ANME-1 ERB7]